MSQAKSPVLQLPLPEEIYDELQAEAASSSQPVSVLAQRVIELWLLKRRRERQTPAVIEGQAKLPGQEWRDFCRSFPSIDPSISYRDLLEEPLPVSGA